MASSAFAAMRIATVASMTTSTTSPRNAAPPPQSCQPMPTPMPTPMPRRASRIGVVARASADNDVPKASPSRRVARRAPKTKTTEEGGATGGAARAKTTKTTTTTRTRKVRKLSSEVKEAAASSSRQVISVERREREAIALKKFTEAKARVLKGADTLEGLVRGGGESTTANVQSGEAAGERLKRLFAERRARGLASVKSKFNDMASPGADVNFDSSDKSEMVDSMLESAAEVEEQNRRAREGYSESSLGVNNSIDPFKLVPGEYVVHRKYGIGQFLGHKVLPIENENGDVKSVPFLFLKYADATARITPESSRRLLYRFCSPGALVKAPKLNKLHDKKSWEEREQKTEATIRRLVVNQMVVYLQRLQCVREPYDLPDPTLSKQFADSFPYTLTPDQTTAIEDIGKDLQQDSPMDRLVIGDVGFGKTEVAMRAMFHVAITGGGVFMLAPTTVLAKQHAANLAARFRPLGLNVELITRHITGSKQNKILDDFKSGQVNIVVGTHKLVNLDESYYNNLKLLVIDEEQRFGVKHKDQISALKAEVDVLTLSATPIPRTLHMAMSGFRDASLVQTPPPERRPINTILAPINDDDIRKAIEHELARNGQIYYIVPRINMIRDAVERLNRMFPDLQIMTAHGQMGGDTLDEAMESFSNGEADCLIATTIVESGLDIPNCNTIIIENVQFFGLASLYQLRGRVGRAGRQAYAYMFHTSDSAELSPGAQERLIALEECCGLGEGFRLSERDMGIRGVGTMFGEKQSGDVDGIGADLYLELLYKQLQRIDHLRIQTIHADDVRVGTGGYEFGVTPFYIATTEASDEVKSTIDSIVGHDDIEQLLELMRDTFGDPDESTRTCLAAREMQILAGDLGIQGIVLDNPLEPVIDLMTDASIMVKELLVEGIATTYDVEVIDNGLRLPTMTDMTIHSKVMYTVKVLRGITRSIPSFVKYL